MPFRESAPRAGFEAPLETKCCLLGPELQRHDDAPRTIPRRLDILSRVVPSESFLDVGGQPDIVTRWITFASEHIDKALFQPMHVMAQLQLSIRCEMQPKLRTRIVEPQELQRVRQMNLDEIAVRLRG